MSTRQYLIVDAYNVICATPLLRESMRRQTETARDRLAEWLRPIHDTEGVRVALVLDSRDGRLTIEHPFGCDTFEYIYAPPELTADGVIERIIQRARKPEMITVASNDNLVRESVRAGRALVLRPEELFEWAEGCEQRLADDARRRNEANAEEFANRINIDLPF